MVLGTATPGQPRSVHRLVGPGAAQEHPIYFLETFVEGERFRGTCYRAANWIYLGDTTGRGKDAPTHQPNRPIKQVLGYPLTKDFRQRLAQGAAG